MDGSQPSAQRYQRRLTSQQGTGPCSKLACSHSCTAGHARRSRTFGVNAEGLAQLAGIVPVNLLLRSGAGRECGSQCSRLYPSGAHHITSHRITYPAAATHSPVEAQLFEPLEQRPVGG